MRAQWLRTLRRTFAIGALALLVWQLVDGALVYSHAEPASDPVAGRIVPVFVHGRELFITADQSRRLGPFNREGAVLAALLAGFVVVKLVEQRQASRRTSGRA